MGVGYRDNVEQDTMGVGSESFRATLAADDETHEGETCSPCVTFEVVTEACSLEVCRIKHRNHVWVLVLMSKFRDHIVEQML